MAINKISGNILQDNLVRGANLAFQGNLVYIDVVNSRVGINTASPTHTLTVSGNAHIDGVAITGNSILADSGQLALGSNANITITGGSSNYILTTDGAGNLSWSSPSEIGNLTVSNTTISTNLASGNITLQPTGNALVVIDATSGLLLPSGNTAQRPSPATAGTIRFSTTINIVELYNGSGWVVVGSNVTNQVLYGDNSTAVFTLNKDSTDAATLVAFNGVLQLPGVAYSIAGNSITFVQAPAVADTIDVRFL